MSEPALHVAHETVGDALVVHVAGEIDMLTAPELQTELEQACARAHPSQNLVADLAKVSFLGSAGMSVLLDINQRCRSRRIPLWIVAATPVAARPLETTGLDRVLQVVGSLEDAVRSA